MEDHLTEHQLSVYQDTLLYLLAGRTDPKVIKSELQKLFGSTEVAEYIDKMEFSMIEVAVALMRRWAQMRGE